MPSKTRTIIDEVESLKLGNLDAVRDWGHAADYCAIYQEMMNKLCHGAQKDLMTYVIATNQSCSVRQFVTEVYHQLGFTDLAWSGTGVETKLHGRIPGDKSNIKVVLVEIDAELFRPGEVPYLQGDTTRIENDLGWKAKVTRLELIKEMISFN